MRDFYIHIIEAFKALRRKRRTHFRIFYARYLSVGILTSGDVVQEMLAVLEIVMTHILIVLVDAANLLFIMNV